MKGGGDAVSAARAVMQTGEYDFAANLQVEDELLGRFEKGGKGNANYAIGADVEAIFLNRSDPSVEVEGERSSVKTEHPLLSDPAVRKALSMLVDRNAVHRAIYGRAARSTANFLNGPAPFSSKGTHWEFNINKAVNLLDEAGWRLNADGIREKQGRRLKLLFQTSTNSARQKTQAIVKSACQKVGIEVELKSIPASLFFSSDVGNSDTMTKFYADLEMWAFLGIPPDPDRLMRAFHSRSIPSKENKWQGFNVSRYSNPNYDLAVDAAVTETDALQRAELYIRANDLLWQDTAVIPLVHRFKVSASSRSLRTVLSGWGNDTDHLQDWYKEPSR